MAQKLFIKDSAGKILINDFKGALQTDFNINHLDNAEKAFNALRKLRDDLKAIENQGEQLFNDVIIDYINAAIEQRKIETDADIIIALDRFLYEFRRGYQPPAALLNPLLMPIKGVPCLTIAGNYDTRSVTNIIIKKIANFSVVAMTSHDVLVSYRDEQFNLFAGSTNPYETSKNAINDVLKRMAQIDVKRGAIVPAELSQRIGVLKDTVFC